MIRPVLPAGFVAAAFLAFGLPAAAAKTTVCTITVNSPDEREVFREYLPAERFEFVELAERGKREWLGKACERGVRCDVLLISGHFAGTDFYSSKHGEHLSVDEMERIPCSGSCPDLFSQLKEVYLFGCDTLKAEPVRSAMPEVVRALLRSGHGKADAERLARNLSERHGESARERMRRIFPDVPVIYGFSSLAPYGRVAGPMLRRHFESVGVSEVGSGQPSARLLKLFGPASMVATHGQRANEPHADYRAEACRYYDDRIGTAGRIAFVHRLLGGDMAQVRMNFDRIERFLGGLGDEDRAATAVVAAAEALARDAASRERYLSVTRATEDPALRVRMVALARAVGWLTENEQRAELAAMIVEMLRSPATGFGEVDLVCTLNKDGSLAGELPRFDIAPSVLQRTASAAALACLGDARAHSRVIEAATSANERDVQVAQAYLRHRPLTEAAQLRTMAQRIARMEGSAAQVRALEVLARHHVGDTEVLDELAGLFARSGSLKVQRAIAEIFLRADRQAVSRPELAETLRMHRVKSPDGHDLIDVLIERLRAS